VRLVCLKSGACKRCVQYSFGQAKDNLFVIVKLGYAGFVGLNPVDFKLLGLL
jgi:hypothetical protein